MKRISLFIYLFLFLAFPGQGQVLNGHGESSTNLDQAFQKAVQDIKLLSGVEIRSYSHSKTNGTLSSYSEGTFICSNHLVRVLEQIATECNGVYRVDIRAEVKMLEIPLCPFTVFLFTEDDAPGETFIGLKSNGENVCVKVFWVSKTGKCGPVGVGGLNPYIGYSVSNRDETVYPDMRIPLKDIKVPVGDYDLVFIATPSRTNIQGYGINSVEKLEEWFWSLPSSEMRRPYIRKNIRLGC